MKNGPEEILGVVFCVIYSVRNKGVDPPGPMPNLAVKHYIAGGTTEGIRGMAREPKGRFCLLCEVG